MLAQGDDVLAIPGTRRRSRLDENLGALDVRLSTTERAAIDAVFPPNAAAGDRYAGSSMQMVNA